MNLDRAGLAGRVRRIASLVGRVAIVIAVAGLVCRLTVRDRYSWIAPLFYGTPPGVLVLLVSFALASNWSRWARFARGAVMLSIVLLTAFLLGSQQNSPRPLPTLAGRGGNSQTRPLRVMFWNVNRLQWGAETIFQAIREVDPDIVGIVEGTGKERPRRLWGEHFPEYRAVAGGFGSVLLVRGSVSSVRLVRFEGKSGFVGVRLRPNLEGAKSDSGAGGAANPAVQELTVWLVDVDSNPFRPRAEALTQLISRAEHESPDIIMGDFNTPLDSVWFEPFRKRFRNAAADRYHGFLVSWPNPVPLMMIDHIWVGPSYQVLNADLSSRWPTDHRMVTTELVSYVPQGIVPRVDRTAHPASGSQTDSDRLVPSEIELPATGSTDSAPGLAAGPDYPTQAPGPPFERDLLIEEELLADVVSLVGIAHRVP